MDRSLSVLVLGGSRADFLQIERRLKLDGVPSTCRRVTSLEELKDATNADLWDVVLAEYTVPGLNVLDGFNVIRARLPDVPVILIAGSIGEQEANEWLKLGVWDFVLKEDPHRLAHLIKHAFKESVQRRTNSAAEKELRRSEERYRQVFLSATDCLFVFPLGLDGQPGQFTEVNNAASEMLGYDREELLQLSPPDLVDATERESLPAKFHQLLNEKRQHVELLLVAKDGRRISVEISGTLFDLESQPTVLGIVTDVTGKKHGTEMLRQATASTLRRHRMRARIDMIVIASLCVLVLFAANYLNAFENLSSWVLQYKDIAVDEIVTTLVFLAFALVIYAFRRSREFGLQVAERSRAEDTLRVLQGELESRVQRRTAEVSHANDALRIEIAEHQRTEAMLSLQSAALDASADAIIITDDHGRIAWVNPAFTALTGHSANESFGKNPRELLKSGAQDQAFYKNLWDTILAGHAWRGEMTNRRKDGSLYPENMTITPVKNTGGEVTHFIAIIRDLTEEKRQKAQFLQAQKMESVGRLAGGIAHDFNNLLTVINGMAELASGGLKEGDPLRADLGEIRRAGERAAALTRQLLAFSRKQVMKPQVVSLAGLVADLRSLLQRVIGEDVTLVIGSAKSKGSVNADPGLIEQVLMNLVVNARDAMPKGGALTIETQDVELDDASVAEHASIQPGSYVLLSVRDTGTGMDDATRAQLFEPFFTTKEQGKGTGLGLATVYGIVEQSGGRISVDTALGRGTTFKIYLPRVAEAAHASQSTVTAPAAGATETILVVEDEDGVRHMAQRMLASSGYTVLTARNADDALLMLARHEGTVHLMLTDVVMPGMSGPDLAVRVAEIRPRMNVLFMSGHTDNAALCRSVCDDRAHFIGKPYTKAELLLKVRKTLDLPPNREDTMTPAPAEMGEGRADGTVLVNRS